MLPIFMGLASGFLFGIATPLSKVLLEEMNSFQLAGLLYLGAALAFLPYVAGHWKLESQWIKRTKKKGSIVAIVVFGGLLGPVFLLMGLKVVASSSVSVWLNMELVATAILGVTVFKDHLDAPAIVGVVLTVAAGVAVAIQDGLGSLLPALFVTLACFCWGIDNHLTAVVDGASPRMITFLKGVFAGATNLAIGFIVTDDRPALSFAALALLLGMVSYGLSVVLYVSSAQRLGATRSQILFSTGPFWGIAAAFVVLGDPVSPLSLVAMSLLALGIVLTNVVAHEHVHKHRPVVHAHQHRHDDGHHDHVHDTGVPPSSAHAHLHEHGAVEHAHRHYPDLHHRHAHGAS